MIPDAALDDRLAFIGTSGSGKTYGAGTAVECILGRGDRAVIIDPLGVWWGLRSLADGKTPPGFDVAIFGGAHGDLPLNEAAGAVIGEAAATMSQSCIIDLTDLGSKASERRFMLAFLEAVYRKSPGDPLHLIFDEADLWAPQRSSEPQLQAKMEQIVRRGRVRGFIPWLITQRPAVLSKDVLSQADGIVAFKLTGSHDRDAIGEWVQGQADRDKWKRIWAEIATYRRGTALVWIPGRGILKEAVAFPAKMTFDSSQTPKRGEKRRTALLKPLDIASLRSKLAAVEAETKANDPRALRAEIARLKAERQKPVVADPAAIDQAEKRGHHQGYGEGYRDGYTNALIAAQRAVEAVSIPPVSQMLPSKMPPIGNGKTVAQRLVNAARQAAAIARGPLPIGETAILVAAAQFDGVNRDQLSVLTGYKRSSRDAYIQRLREKGLVEVNGQTVTPTPDGLASLPSDYAPLPTGRALQDYWLGRLPEGEKRILSALIDAFPNAVDRASLDSATGYKRSSRDAYLQRMKAKRLVEIDGPAVRASDNLF